MHALHERMQTFGKTKLAFSDYKKGGFAGSGWSCPCCINVGKSKVTLSSSLFHEHTSNQAGLTSRDGHKTDKDLSYSQTKYKAGYEQNIDIIT